jgi:large conductance mechanosensitive channel
MGKKNKTIESSKHVWADFKKFITRGNILDMAVGVIMGSAFGAIVTALVNILLSLCTWAVPGGIKGLVTVLPAANAAQNGVATIGQQFASSDLPEMTIAFAKSQGVIIDNSSASFVSWQTSLLSKYTLHGTSYYFNGSAIIDWGTFINAIISFVIIALVLFTIVKTFSSLQAKRDALKAEQLEEYYVKHPEERPAPAKPNAPVDTPEVALLKQILVELKDTPKVK